MLRKVIVDVEADGKLTPPNLLDAVKMICASWHSDVTPTTITNCFRKAGMSMGSDSEVLPAVSTPIDGFDSLSDAVSSFISLVGVPSGFDQSDFETIDNNVVCVEPLLGTDESIIDSNNGTADSNDEEKSQEIQETQRIGPDEAKQLVEKLQCFFLQQPDTDWSRWKEK